MIISIANQKGGVGKTTTSQALFSGLVTRGYKVLAIDLDPQANMSTALGAIIDGVTVYELMGDVSIPASSVIQHINNGDVIPSNILLAGAEREFSQKMNREKLLARKLESIKSKYDFIIIDTPPALGILTINAFVASDKVIIPMSADMFSLHGIGHLSNTLNEVKYECNANIMIEGILLTRHNSRTVLSKDLTITIDNVASDLGTKVYSTKIRSSVAIQEAQTQAIDILNYANANAQIDYNNFIDEFLQGLNK